MGQCLVYDGLLACNIEVIGPWERFACAIIEPRRVFFGNDEGALRIFLQGLIQLVWKTAVVILQEYLVRNSDSLFLDVVAKTVRIPDSAENVYLSVMRWTLNAPEVFAFPVCYVVYDKKVPTGSSIPTLTGNENYTLLFDNYDSGLGADAQKDVSVALEFVNESGPAFYGEHNLIPTGGKFYLVGKLTIGSNRITNDDWEKYYPVPPYNDSGESQKITRIFVQDFMTDVTFKIGATSLQKAYNTIPDLRSTQTSLGLSVNLKWQKGLTFSDVTLGH